MPVTYDNVPIGCPSCKAIIADPFTFSLFEHLAIREELEPRKAKVVGLRIFLGCTLDRDLRFALAWLFEPMSGPA